MKTKLTTKTLIISAAVLLVGAAVAFAGGGYWGGPGGHMMGYGAGYGMGPGMMGYGYGPGSGYGMGPGMMGYGPGYGYGMGPGMMYGYGGAGAGYWGNLTPDQRAKLDASQQKFYTETQGLREQIQDKRYALQSEFAKAAPDEGKIANLQKELSKLEGEFDQKAVQHQLEVRKLLPEDARGGFGPGYGGGYCWR